MLSVLKKFKFTGKKAIEIGTGSGILAKQLAKTFDNVIAVDIDEEAVQTVNDFHLLNLRAFQSNLFSNVVGKFDLIIFNPPYLPCPYEEDKELCCGDGKIISDFLEQAKEHLNKKGRILLLISSLTPIKIEGDLLAKQDVGFETLEVRIPYKFGQLISVFHESGKIDQIEHGVGSVSIKGKVPLRLVADYEKFRVT